MPASPSSSASSSMPMFHHQATTGPDKDLCAFFASRHFLGDLHYPTFLSDAASVYTPLGLSQADAEQMVTEGNDPAVVDAVLKGNATGRDALHAGDWQNSTRILIALKNRAHFITLRRTAGGTWMNYDSLQSSPTEIANIDSFLKVNPGQRYWVG